MKNRKTYMFLMIISLFLSLTFGLKAYDKANHYNNPNEEELYEEDYAAYLKHLSLKGEDYINAYVGSDAFNYVINATYTAAFSFLAGVFLLLSTLFGIRFEQIGHRARIVAGEQI